jgi:SAM-dependent methyltransferase
MMSTCRVHFGCGAITPPGWINVDRKRGPGIDVRCDVIDGLPFPDDSVDYITSQHALQDLGIFQQVPAMAELRRVLRPGGLLRLGLPDLDRAIQAYRAGRRDHFIPREWETLGGDFITHILWYGETSTLFTGEFAEELLRKAGFARVAQVEYRMTVSRFPEVVEMDHREHESFYVEAFKEGLPRSR